MDRIKKFTLRIILVQIVIWLIVPMALIYSQPDRPIKTTSDLSFDSLAAKQNKDLPQLQTIASRTGGQLAFRDFPTSNTKAPLMILIHGSGWHSIGMHHLANKIAQSGAAHVITPDLRGHGFKPERRGDIDYIGQLEDDLADLIKAKSKSGQTVVLAGHSSGGGLVQRFAGGDHGSMIHAAVLLAPFVHHQAPNMRENAGSWSFPMMRRLIGLHMQNMVGIHLMDHTPVIRFNHDDSVLNGPLGATATQTYSHRLLKSMNPRDDYEKDIAALPKFIVLVGENDAAFKPEAYQELFSKHSSKGTIKLLPELDHTTILTHSETADEVVAFLQTL